MPRFRLVDRKLSRTADARRILIKTLATQLIEHGRITTTRPRAKAVLPYVERLLSTAKRGDLSARRSVISKLDTVAAAHRTVDVIAPQLKRTSGYVRLLAASPRFGDDAPMASLELVDEIKDVAAKPKTKSVTTKSRSTAKASSSQTAKTKTRSKTEVKS